MAAHRKTDGPGEDHGSERTAVSLFAVPAVTIALGLAGWALRETYHATQHELAQQKAQLHELQAKQVAEEEALAELRITQQNLLAGQARIEARLETLVKLHTKN